MLCVSLAACLPGKRDNTAPPPDASDHDSSALDGSPLDGGAADAAAQDSGPADSGDTAAADAQDSGPAPLPKGCSADKDCDVLNVNACVSAACNLGSGVCEQTDVADGSPCTLADPCVVETACSGGVCAGKDKDCDDKNQCTEDSCVAFDGCRHLAADKICNDGNPCTLADACTGTTCSGVPQDCAVLDACKVGACDPSNGDCDYDGNAKAGTACDDNDPCTAGDGCDGEGGCAGNKVDGAKLCDDKEPCTRDVCDATKKGGCAHIPVAGAKQCTDGEPCTDDACKDGKCVSVDVVCDDFKPCTKDSCAPAADGVDPKCVHIKLNQGSCVDAKPCAAEATCLAGSCSVVKVKDCDDGNVCTKDSCEAKAGGCLYLVQAGPCNDGSGCTKDDACKAGKCVGTAKDCSDGDVCTLDTCDPITAKCANPLAPEGYPCGANSWCKLGTCKVKP